MKRGAGMRKTAWAVYWILFVGTSSAPQEATNFSGTFVLASLTGEHIEKTLPKIHLKITQNSGSLEIVESFDDGKSITNKYFLNGRESKNTTSG